MTTIRVDLKDFPRRIKKDMQARERRIEQGIRQAAVRGARYVQTQVPVAFGELKNSIFARGHSIVADAPYAAAVENGSRPHWMPIAPLLAWVKLRGMQGLYAPKSSPGPTSAHHAQSIAAAFKAMERSRSLDVKAPMKIARAIQAAIAKRGTKPHWFVRGSLPEIQRILDQEIKKALPEKG